MQNQFKERWFKGYFMHVHTEKRNKSNNLHFIMCCKHQQHYHVKPYIVLSIPPPHYINQPIHVGNIFENLIFIH